MILKTIDQQTYDRFQKCKYCQIDFEMKLRKEGKWNDWVKEQEEKRWEAVLAEYNAEMQTREDSETLKFDKKVANAVAKESHRE